MSALVSVYTVQAFKVMVYVLFACLNLMLLLEMVCFPTPVHKPRNRIEEWLRPLSAWIFTTHRLISLRHTCTG